jgi:transposase
VILEDGAVELLNALFPHLAGIHVERVVASGRLVRLEAATRGSVAACPACGQTSNRVHSRYERSLADRGVGGREVTIQLRVRRFFCDDPSCPRRIFAEQVAGLTERYRRCSPVLRAILAEVGLASGGRAGERMTRKLDAARSRTTLLRLVRALPEPTPDALRAVGVDEFALRRGHTYGTVLVDMDTRRPVDVLTDRTSTTLAAWLEKHPGIEVVCRDRAGPYAEGASSGAPQAQQVADRWHLLKNLVEVVERILKRNRAALVDEPPEADSAACEVGPTPIDGPRAARTRQRHRDVHALADRGMNLTGICSTLKLDPKTVNRYLRAASPEELIAPDAQRATSLDRFKTYLTARFADGCTNAARLWTEIHAQGYRGHRRTVRRYLDTLAAAATERKRPEEYTVREVRQWILRRPDRLDPRDRDRLQAICAHSPIVAATTELAQAFARLLRERRGQQLGAWVQMVEAADIPELRAFAVGLRKDWAAVQAGLTVHWSSGAVEGHVNRIKMLKRQMYGRANVDLLRRRVLLAG